MTINERIKFFRKEILHFNQRQLANELGMAQTGISGLEQNGRTVTDLFINTLCLKYNLSEAWLRDGIEPMYMEAPTFSLDQFARERGASELELQILKAYFSLDPDIRKAVIEHFRSQFATVKPHDFSDIPDTPEEFEKMYPPIEDDEEKYGGEDHRIAAG
ncbi:hypothetical protein EV209_1371 [Cuneatibacter caecimuris]|uniref:HTH cro/C1-type domain-containing protein n=1 Tax=Cuneatibacter caecimuris TaxID=1796618 RepID=A0A4Q7PKA4_9FIRM|nr:hypothetical protein EV209_1371 [Cuneatibacter caecimuris]